MKFLTNLRLLTRTADERVRDVMLRRHWLIWLAIGMAAVSVGCTGRQKEPVEEVEETVIAPEPLTMLVVGDPELGKRIARQWSARRDGELTIVDQTAVEFSASEFDVPSGIDVIVYPPVMLAELVSRDEIMPMPREIWNSDGFNKSELLSHFRLSIIRLSDDPWAVPLGNPSFTLLCNRPLFERMQLAPPITWEMLDQDLKKIDSLIQSEQSGFGQLVAKVDMPLASGWAASTFLARVAPAIRQAGSLSTVFDRSTMAPLIVAPPFVEALEQLKSIATSRSLDLNPADVYRLAVEGESSIAMAWPARGFSGPVNADSTDETVEGTNLIMIHSLPGTTQWYDPQAKAWVKRKSNDQGQFDLIGFSGLVASVTRRSSNDQTAWELLEWLSSKSISLLTLVDSPTVGPFRTSHLSDANVSRWTGDRISLDVADEFAKVVSEIQDRPAVFIFPRIPGGQRYLDTLDGAIREFVSGEGAAHETLEAVAAEWELITDSLDRQKQILGLRKQSGF